MTSKQKQRYVFAIYFGLTALAAAFALFGSLLNEGTIQSLLLNLSTELMGAVLIFFIVNWFFMLDSESSLIERVERVLTILEREHSVLLGSKKSRKILDLGERFNSAKQIDLLGYSLYKLFIEHKRYLIQCLKNGTKIRILLVNPEGKAGELISAHKAGAQYYLQWNQSFTILESLQKESISNDKGGGLEIKVIDFIPSCDMIMLDRDDYEKGIMKVSINGPYATTTKSNKILDRRHLIFKKRNDPDDFETWLEQFESCWQDGQPWNPVNS